MLPQCSHITRKRGVFYFRKRLPRPSAGEVALSLRTRSFREAQWLAEALARVFQNQVARYQMNPDISALLQQRLREALEEQRKELLSTPYVPAEWTEGDFPPPSPGAQEAAELEAKEAHLRETLRTRDIRPAMPAAKAFAQKHGLPTDEQTLGELSLSLVQVSLQISEQKRKWLSEGVIDRIDVSPVPPAALPAGTPQPLSEAKPGPLASELVEPYFERRRTIDRSRHHVMSQDRGTLARFLEVAGDRPIGSYDRGDVTRFLDTLRKMPSGYGQSPKNKSRPLAAIIADADPDAERLSEKTIKRHSSALGTFFQFAVDQGHLKQIDRVELIADHSFKTDKSARTQRDSWTLDELRKLFASPVWTGCKSVGRRSAPGSLIIRDAKFWLPLLALFHGARLEEFADLYRRDIGKDGEVWFVRLTEEGGRSLKNANATRNVPMHPELIRIGFLDYVGEAAPGEDDPLFPDLEPQGKDKRRGPRITRWFTEYRRSVDVYRADVAMHAFRHTMNTRLRDVITDWQQERHVQFIVGHAQGGGEGSERYDKGPGLKAAANTLALLSYPELDFSHLYKPAERLTAQRSGSDAGLS